MTQHLDRPALRTLLAWLGLSLGSACTQLSDLDIHQCDANADCDTLSGPTSRCAKGRCIEGCLDNAHCASVDPRRPICEHLGGECYGLTSAGGECYVSSGYDPISMGALTAQSMLIVGAFASTLRSASWLTLQLAENEITSHGGLPGLTQPLPLVVVLCDASTTAMNGAMDHLVRDLHAGVLIASLEDEPLRVAVEGAGTRGRALFLSPNGADPWSTAPGSSASQHLWFLGPSYDQSVAAYPAVIRRVAAALEARGADQQLLRVATLTSDAREDRDLASAVEKVIDLDGKNLYQLEREGRFRSLQLLDGSPQELQQVANFLPDIVLLFSGGSSRYSPYPPRSLRLDQLEASAREPGSWRPIYIAGPRNVDDPFLSSRSADASFRARIVGVRSDVDVDEDFFGRFALRFREAYPRSTMTDVELRGSVGLYDALYYLAYAAAVARMDDAQTTAEAFAVGLAKVTDPGGERVVVGAEGFEGAMRLVTQRAAFNLYGVAGPGSFDPVSHVRSGPVRAYCWDETGEASLLANYDPLTDDLSSVRTGCAEEAFVADTD